MKAVALMPQTESAGRCEKIEGRCNALMICDARPMIGTGHFTECRPINVIDEVMERARLLRRSTPEGEGAAPAHQVLTVAAFTDPDWHTESTRNATPA
jgi:hypothetical protein